MRILDPGRPFFDDDRAAGGRVFFYSNRTTTLKTTYSDLAQTVANTNPITLDSDGRLPVEVFGHGPYTVRVNDINGDVIWDEDDINNSSLDTIANLKDFDGAADGTTDDLAALNRAIAQAPKELIIDGDLLLSSGVTVPRTILVRHYGTTTVTSGTFVALRIDHRGEGWESGGSHLDMRAFGGYADQGSSVDITTALNLARAEALTTSNPFLRFAERGEYWFLSKPDDINFKLNISGTGQNQTTLNKDWASASITDGIFNFVSGASSASLREMVIRAQANSRSGGVGTGCNVSVVADATGSPSWVTLENLYLTSAGGSSNSYNNRSLEVDGTANQTSAPGVRDLWVVNCSCFGGESGSARFSGTVSLGIAGGGGFFSAGGDSGTVLFTGTSAVRTQNFNVNNPYMDNVSIDEVQRGTITVGNIAGNVTNTSNVENVHLHCSDVDGTVQDNWLNCKYQGSDDLTAADGDTTPSVANAKSLTTANTSSTTITGLDDMVKGQEVLLLINDSNTNIDFSGTNLKGNGGVDVSPATNGDAYLFRKGPGANIYAVHVDV